MSLKRTLLIVLAVLVIALAGLYFWIQMTIGGIGGETITYVPQFNATIRETGIIDYSTEALSGFYSTQKMFYVVLDANGTDVSWINASLKMYSDPIPTEIYLLDYPCVQCHKADANGTEYTDLFRTGLEAELKHEGLIPSNGTLASKKINQLELIPTSYILIVPTGKIPSPLVDPASEVNIKKLGQKGCVIIYIGDDPSQSLNRMGVAEGTPNSNLVALNLVYREINLPKASSPYHLDNGLYILGALNTSRVIGGTISAIRTDNGTGYLVAFPNTLDLGWTKDGIAYASKDVATLIARADWQLPYATGSSSIPATFGSTKVENTITTIYATPGPANSGFGRVFFIASDPEKNTVSRYVDLNIVNPVHGKLTSPASGLNNTQQTFKVDFNESFSQPVTFDVYLRTYQDTKRVDEQKLEPVSFQTVYSTRMHYIVNLTGGDHILRVEDYYGNIYAQSYLHIPLVTLEPVGIIDWDNPEVEFQLLEDGKPVRGTAILVSLDGGTPVQLATDDAGGFTFTPGAPIGYGFHVFEVEATGKTLTFKVERQKKATFLDNPVNLGILGLTIIAAIAAIVLRTTEKPTYIIDVPDFLPARKELVPISKFSFLNLLDAINNEYRWKFMPLSAQEIKNGVRKKLTHNGKPILISDYNLERMMEKLVAEGSVKSALSLYGLAEWEKQSGKSMKYLATFRKLRNFLIQNAVMFTDLGKQADCDMLVNYRGVNYYLQIYEGEGAIKKALLSASLGRNFLVFADKAEMKAVKDALEKSTSNAAIMLRMEQDNRRIVFVHLGALGVIIGRAS